MLINIIVIKNIFYLSKEPNRPPSRQRRRRKPQGPEEAEEPQQNADDIVDIRYVGGAIPSRTFKFLQQCVGDTQPSELI